MNRFRGMMKKMVVWYLLMLMLWVTVAETLAEGIPQQIRYQGRLIDADGIPVESKEYNLGASLWTAESGGSNVWSEAHVQVPVVQGYFSLVLGGYSNGLANALAEGDRYIEIAGAGISSTRQRLLSVPYATIAGNATTVQGVDVLEQLRQVQRIMGIEVSGGDPSSEFVEIPAGINSGYDPDYGAYSLTNASAFMMGRYEVTNDEMVRVLQWALDQSKVGVRTGSNFYNGNFYPYSNVVNKEGDVQELLSVLHTSSSRIVFISSTNSTFSVKSTKGSGYPCVAVDWHGAAAYCNYRSELEGKDPCYDWNDWSCDSGKNGYRLPTSAEWVYAARGGLRGKRFPWGDTINHGNANYRADSSAYSYDASSYTTPTYHPDYNDGEAPYTSPVGDFTANGYGLYDTIGNVSEWCNDWHPDHVGLSYVDRGGGWSSDAGNLHFEYNRTGPPVGSGYNIGFRVVLPAI